MGTRDVWLFVFMLGILAFVWPLPEVFRAHAALYLYAVWAAFIALVYFFSRSARQDGGG